MRIIEEYKRLIQEIAALKSEITSKERHLRRLVDTYKPAEVTAISYSHANMRGTRKKVDIVGLARAIDELQFDISCLKEDLKEAISQRKELEKVVNGLCDTEKQVAMIRMRNPKMPAWKIAKLAHVSTRTVYNYITKANKELKSRVK